MNASASKIQLWEVGGCVRDELLGLDPKDVDFAVEADSFAAMRAALIEQGFTIFVESEEHLTIRAKTPPGSALRARVRDADFVLCRKDGPTKDGRRPEFVEPGTLMDDLARRDFTVNAMARDPFTGDLIDPFGGADDLDDGILRFVGSPMDRIEEDGLRVLRGFRFSITKGLVPERVTAGALTSANAARMLQCVSVERVADELAKMFAADTLGTVDLLGSLPGDLKAAIFRDGLRLAPTLAKSVKVK